MLIDFSKLTPIQFEELVYNLLIAQGFDGEQSPSEGPDQGIDAIVSWPSGNPIDNSSKRYIVQCKNYTKSVGVNTVNIPETILSAGADGYILAVASRLTSGLQDKILAQRTNFNKSIIVYTGHEIIDFLINYKNIFIQYFPDEYKRYNELFGIVIKKDISDLIEKLFGEKLDEMALNRLARKYIILGFNNIGELENVLTINKTNAAIV